MTNELAFSNDITGKPGVLCQFQRIYLTEAERGSGFEFEYTRRHKRRVFIFTKLHAKSTNARGEYFGIKYCQTVPFPPSN